MRILEVLLEYKNPVEALNTLLALWRRQSSNSAGEAESSKNLYKTILAKIAKEFNTETARQMDQYIQSGQADRDDSRLKPARRNANGDIVMPAQKLAWPPLQVAKPQPKPQEKPQPKPQFNGITLLRVLRMTDMSAGIRGIDKIWGYAQYETQNDIRLIAFWGRYGKQIQTKSGNSRAELFKLVRQKLDKGYKHVDESSPEYKYILNQLSSFKK